MDVKLMKASATFDVEFVFECAKNTPNTDLLTLAFKLFKDNQREITSNIFRESIADDFLVSNVKSDKDLPDGWNDKCLPYTLSSSPDDTMIISKYFN